MLHGLINPVMQKIHNFRMEEIRLHVSVHWQNINYEQIRLSRPPGGYIYFSHRSALLAEGVLPYTPLALIPAWSPCGTLLNLQFPFNIISHYMALFCWYRMHIIHCWKGCFITDLFSTNSIKPMQQFLNIFFLYIERLFQKISFAIVICSVKSSCFLKSHKWT